MNLIFLITIDHLSFLLQRRLSKRRKVLMAISAIGLSNRRSPWECELDQVAAVPQWLKCKWHKWPQSLQRLLLKQRLHLKLH
jgi:hypothetical protein